MIVCIADANGLHRSMEISRFVLLRFVAVMKLEHLVQLCARLHDAWLTCAAFL